MSSISNQNNAGFVYDKATDSWVSFVGPKGETGPAMNMRGPVNDSSLLPAKGDPGDAYLANDTGNLWFWDADLNQWRDAGRFRGERGPAGETLKINGAVATAANLPSTPSDLSVFISSDNAHLYIYDKTSSAASAGPIPPAGYVDLGAIAGPQGPTGTPGPIGPQGASSHVGTAVDTELNLPATGTAGEMRLVKNTGHMWVWNTTTSAWVDGGQITFNGDPAHMKGPVPTETDLPPIGTPGELRIVADTLHLWGWDANAQAWVDGGGFDHLPIGTKTGQVITWSNDTRTWNAADPVGGKVAQWTSKTYEAQQIVWYQGFLYRASVDVLSNDEPGVSPAWDRVGIHSIDEIPDVDTQTNTPQDGHGLIWNNVNGVWEPASVMAPVLFIGRGAIDPARISDHGGNHGMPAGTIPDPGTYAPVAGDLYLNLANASFSSFTGDTGFHTRRGHGASGIEAYKGAVSLKMADFADVAAITPQDKWVLIYDFGSKLWTPMAAPWATKQYADLHLEQTVLGLARTANIIDMVAAAPAQPRPSDAYIATAAGTWGGEAVAKGDVLIYTLTSGGSYDWHVLKPKNEERHLVLDEGKEYRWDAASSDWLPVVVAGGGGGSVPVGTIVQSLLDEAQFASAAGADANKWALCDGRSIAGTPLAAALGRNFIWDMRGAYFRMAGNNSTNAAWAGGALNAYAEDATRLPRTPFKADSSGVHQHLGGKYVYADTFGETHYGSQNLGVDRYVTANIASQRFNASLAKTSADGTHEHTISGGDAETRPKTFVVNYFVRTAP